MKTNLPTANCAIYQNQRELREYNPMYNQEDILPLFVVELNEQLARESTRFPSSEQRDDDPPIYIDPEPGTTNDLSVGSLVEISNDVSDEPLYGVVRWLGKELGTNHILAGVELENEHNDLPLNCTDGVHNGVRLFNCLENKALFVPLAQCHKDSRFQDGTPTPIHNVTEKIFGDVSIFSMYIFSLYIYSKF